MLRGSLLATLAGTATVCAGLVYLKPEAETPDQISNSAAASISPSRDRSAAAAATAAVAVGAGGEGGASGSRDPSMREGGEEGEGLGLPEAGGGATRLSKYRAGLRRCITALSPSANNLVRGGMQTSQSLLSIVGAPYDIHTWYLVLVGVFCVLPCFWLFVTCFFVLCVTLVIFLLGVAPSFCF